MFTFNVDRVIRRGGARECGVGVETVCSLGAA
jgi:hypothetical protein